MGMSHNHVKQKIVEIYCELLWEWREFVGILLGLEIDGKLGVFFEPTRVQKSSTRGALFA
jgi:hypothetical protein